MLQRYLIINQEKEGSDIASVFRDSLTESVCQKGFNEIIEGYCVLFMGSM